MSSEARNMLSLTNVEKSFGDRVILDDLTWGLSEGEACGLIGANGTGKSTLLKIMAGLEPIDSGSLATRRTERVAYLAQTTTLPEGTVFEVLKAPFLELERTIVAYEEAATRQDPNADDLFHRIEQLGGYDWEHRVKRAASLLKIDELLDVKTSRLSGGEAKRVALAELWLSDASIILLDEPTNHIDTATVEWIESWIQESRSTFVVVTHDRYFLDEAVSQIAELREGKLHTYRGGFTEYLVSRAEEEELRERTAQRTYQILKVQLEWARRSPKARRTNAKAKVKDIEARAAHHRKLAEKTRTTEITFAEPDRLGKTILELHDVAKAFEPSRPLIGTLSMHLKRGARIGVLGPNGTGKSTLLKLITGELEPDSGFIIRGKNSRIAMLDQHRTVLDPSVRVRDIVSPDGRDIVFIGGKEKIHVASYLSRFNFPTETHRVPVSRLSGGERNRLALARFLLEDANIILMDEPTNDLDLTTIHILEQALLSFPGCVITVSHDRYFLDRVATTIVAFEADVEAQGTVTVMEGDYTTYRRLRRQFIEAPKTSPVAAKEKSVKTAPKKKLTYGEELELKKLEPEVEALEEEVSQREKTLGESELWSTDYQAAMALQGELDTLKAELTEKYDRWEYLMSKMEE